MRPKLIPTPADGETDMLRNRLDNMIDMRNYGITVRGCKLPNFATRRRHQTLSNEGLRRQLT